MLFDAVLFEGDNPFDLDELTSVHRLTGITLEELQALENLLSKGNGTLTAIYYYRGN